MELLPMGICYLMRVEIIIALALPCVILHRFWFQTFFTVLKGKGKGNGKGRGMGREGEGMIIKPFNQ